MQFPLNYSKIKRNGIKRKKFYKIMKKYDLFHYLEQKM